MSTLVEQLQPELLSIARKQFLQEGLQKGRQEERIEMAKTLFSSGVSIDIIARTTKLSEKEIKSLIH